MPENNLNDVEVLRWFEAGVLKPVPPLPMAESMPNQDAEVLQCAE
jgi:hypothetical protein